MAQTETWARQIYNEEGYDKLPEYLKEIYESDTDKGFNPDIFLVYCPATRRDGKPLLERLLYVYDTSLICVEKDKQGISRRQFKAKEIGVIENGFVLLDAWMTVAGKNGSGDDILTIHHNNTVAHFFKKMTAMLRAMALGIEFPIKYDNSISDSLREESFKYMNYTRNLMFEDDKLIGYVFQKQIKGKFMRMLPVNLTNNHVLMLTEHEVIQMTEGRKQIEKYGCVSTFFIRRHMDSPLYSEPDKTNRLQLCLSSGLYRRDTLFDEEKKIDLMTLLSH